jgi:hypothetical protein
VIVSVTLRGVGDCVGSGVAYIGDGDGEQAITITIATTKATRDNILLAMVAGEGPNSL